MGRVPVLNGEGTCTETGGAAVLNEGVCCTEWKDCCTETGGLLYCMLGVAPLPSCDDEAEQSTTNCRLNMV